MNKRLLVLSSVSKPLLAMLSRRPLPAKIATISAPHAFPRSHSPIAITICSNCNNSTSKLLIHSLFDKLANKVSVPVEPTTKRTSIVSPRISDHLLAFVDKGASATRDPRLEGFERTIEDEYADLREKYNAPKYPIVLCHGLLGFDELRLGGNIIPPILYWRGIGEALTDLGAEVITTTVPASGSIEVRATALMKQIEARALEKTVNLIGHSMGGIDCRYMISKLKPETFRVASLTTIATPHRGSSFADYVLELIGKKRLPRFFKAMEAAGIQTGAFAQLTTTYMEEIFNPVCPDVQGVKYFSYGAAANPGIFSVFRKPHNIIYKLEGPNDGLVSVKSAMHGVYKGTLIGPSHLDIINWTNRLRWMIFERRFNAIAFYCDIADMLAKESL